MKFDYKPPTCCVDGCDGVADYHNVKYNGYLYEHMCPDHYNWIKENSKFENPDRPKCACPDCNRLAMQSSVGKNGKIYYKELCYVCSEKRWVVNRKQSDNTLDAFMLDLRKRPNYGDLNPYLEKNI